MAKKAQGSIGQTWFIRNKDATALTIVKLTHRYGHGVWGYQIFGNHVCIGPTYGQDGVDFDLVQPFTEPTGVNDVPGK